MPINPLQFERTIIQTPKDFQSLLGRSKEQKTITFDIETTSLDPYEATIVAMVFVLPSNHSFYLRLQMEEKKNSPYISDYLILMKQLMEDPSIQKIGHNLKFEYSVLKQAYRISMRGTLQDTMLLEYLLHPAKIYYNLEAVLMSTFDIDKKSYRDLVKEHEKILDIPPEQLQEYTFQDGEYTWKLYLEQQKMYHQLGMAMQKIYTEMDIPLLLVLARMELNGTAIDVSYLQSLQQSMRGDLKELEEQIIDLAGKPFNINSTKQLQHILFEHLGIPPLRKTKTGYSTDTRVLHKLASQYNIASLLLQQRRLAKLLNTYIEVLPTLVNPHTKKLHTHYSQITAATGRLSSHSPNLQNIPIKTPEGKQIRRAFISPEGTKVVSLDYSQVELRLLAKLSKDPVLLETYLQNKDIHLQTASLLFGMPENEVNDDQRRIAKTVNFSVIYGVSAYTLSEELSLTPRQAQFFIDCYFEAYKGVKQYIQTVLEGGETYQNCNHLLR